MPASLFLTWKMGFTGPASQTYVQNPGAWALPWLEGHVLDTIVTTAHPNGLKAISLSLSDSDRPDHSSKSSQQYFPCSGILLSPCFDVIDKVSECSLAGCCLGHSPRQAL